MGVSTAPIAIGMRETDMYRSCSRARHSTLDEPAVTSTRRAAWLLIHLCLIVCVNSACVGAASPYTIRRANPLSEPWRISRFGNADVQSALCVAEDAEKNMWFGTVNGVVRYDGYQWKSFSTEHGLPPVPVVAMIKRPNGALIAATDQGLFQSLIDAKSKKPSGKWQKIFPISNQSAPKIDTLVDSGDDGFWACTEWGLIQFASDKTTLFTSKSFASIVKRFGIFDEVKLFPNNVLPTDRMYVGSGLYLIGDTIAFLDKDGPANEAGLRIGDRILSVNKQKSNFAFHLNRAKGHPISLSALCQETGSIETIAFRSGESQKRIFSPAIHSFLKSGDGKLWCGAVQGRVLMSEDNGETWTTWQKSDLIVGLRPTLVEDRNGDILLLSSERNGGFVRFDGNDWHSTELPLLTGIDYHSPMVQTRDGTIWAGALNRLHVFRNSVWNTFDTRDKDLPGDSQRMYVASDGAIWILGLRQGPVRIALSDNEYWSLEDLTYQCCDRHGNCWFIDTQRGLTVRKTADSTVAFDASDGVVDSPIGMLQTDQGVVVFGGHRQAAALSRFDGETWKRFEFPNVAPSFSGKGFMVADDGQIWLSAKGRRFADQNGGFVVGRGDKWKHVLTPQTPKYATSINQLADGRIMFAGAYGVVFLDDDAWQKADDPIVVGAVCRDAVVDSSGIAWVGTRTRGILRFDGINWTQLSEIEGLPPNEIGTVAVNDGELWLSSTRGLYRFDGNEFIRSDLPRFLGRRSIRFADNGDLWFDGNKRISRDRAGPTASIASESVSLDRDDQRLLVWQGTDAWNRTPVDRLMWSYRIDNGPWTPFSHRRREVIQGLSPGAHHLVVRSRDQDFNISPDSSPLQISVAPPFWMQTWFVTLCALSIATVSWLSVGLIRRGIALRKANDELRAAKELISEQFAEKAAQFRAICDCSPSGIFVTDHQGLVTYINREMSRLLGLTAQSASGHGWAEAVHPDDRDRLVTAWLDAIDTEAKFSGEGRFLHSDGTIVWFEVAADAIESDKGDRLGFVGAVENITQRVNAERELRDSNERLRGTLDQLEFTQEQAIKRERLAALGQMAAGVAHDINNSLTPILAYAELLASDEGVSGQPHRWAEFIRTGVRDMSDTVQRLDHFYRSSHRPELLETVSLTDLVAQTVEMTKPRWERSESELGKVVHAVVQPNASPEIRVMASQIRSVITNLIFNAVDAISGEGSIVIRVDDRTDKAVVEIEDDGAGMSAEALSRCLEPFFTTKPKGSGLGLSECHGIVSQHGGTMEVDSTLGKGTLVRISLPMSNHAVASKFKDDAMLEHVSEFHQENRQLAPTMAPPADQSSAKVLCIDDEPLIRQSVTAMLSSIGLDVETASDGPNGLSMIDENDFQLVICDCGLPGMDGTEVIRQIKQRAPNLPVVMISGWSQSALDGVEADEFLRKPVAYEDFLRVIKKHVPVEAIQL